MSTAHSGSSPEPPVRRHEMLLLSVGAMRRIGGLVAALAIGDALQCSIESHQARVIDECGRER